MGLEPVRRLDCSHSVEPEPKSFLKVVSESLWYVQLKHVVLEILNLGLQYLV